MKEDLEKKAKDGVPTSSMEILPGGQRRLSVAPGTVTLPEELFSSSAAVSTDSDSRSQYVPLFFNFLNKRRILTKERNSPTHFSPSSLSTKSKSQSTSQMAAKVDLLSLTEAGEFDSPRKGVLVSKLEDEDSFDNAQRRDFHKASKHKEAKTSLRSFKSGESDKEYFGTLLIKNLHLVLGFLFSLSSSSSPC